MVQEFPYDLDDCQAMQTDFDRLEVWADIFKIPKAVFVAHSKNVPAHMVYIEQDIRKLMADVKTEELFFAGEEIADILVMSIGPATAQQPEEIVFTQW